MRRWLETRGYLLCFDLCMMRGWVGRALAWAWCGIWYRYYCPYPIQDRWTARACNAAGKCGCNNLDRYAHPSADRGGAA